MSRQLSTGKIASWTGTSPSSVAWPRHVAVRSPEVAWPWMHRTGAWPYWGPILAPATGSDRKLYARPGETPVAMVGPGDGVALTRSSSTGCRTGCSTPDAATCSISPTRSSTAGPRSTSSSGPTTSSASTARRTCRSGPSRPSCSCRWWRSSGRPRQISWSPGSTRGWRRSSCSWPGACRAGWACRDGAIGWHWPCCSASRPRCGG